MRTIENLFQRVQILSKISKNIFNLIYLSRNTVFISNTSNDLY